MCGPISAGRSKPTASLLASRSQAFLHEWSKRSGATRTLDPTTGAKTRWPLTSFVALTYALSWG